jgi:formylglycine-generating enzyme required for sulfatase activity
VFDAIPRLDGPTEDRVPAGIYPLTPRAGGPSAVLAGDVWLDRYPVTVERYQRFIDARGYQEREYWDDDGWAFRTESSISAPRFFGEPSWARFLRRGRPIVGVSWWEAAAFCRFEGRRLPSEREWEAAARGPLGFAYPWGPVWEEGRIAVRGVGPRVTWPVGFFRRARGPFGHLDLVGNVWQWTADPLDTEEPNVRVARGGSWASRPDQNRTDHLNAYRREQRHSHVGFRTARVLTPSSQ